MNPAPASARYGKRVHPTQPPNRLAASVLVVLAIFPLLLAGGCGNPRAPAAALEITEARIRTPAPGQDKTAAYFDIRTVTDADITLTGAETVVARSVEIHRIVRDGDRVRMARQSTVVIPAGKTVRFAPGGLHLMVFGVSSPVDGAEFVLLTQDGRKFGARFKELELGAQQ